MEVVSVNKEYASGARRLVAVILDWILINAMLRILFLPWLVLGWGWSFSWDGDWHQIMHHGLWTLAPILILFHTVRFLIWIIYFAGMESSKYQGTVGKIAMGVKVVDRNYQRLDFAKALLRNLSKILSGLVLCIGYLMIIFDDRKQGLHDKIADTFVVKQ